MFFHGLNLHESIVQNQIIVFHADFCEHAAEAIKFAFDDKWFQKDHGAQGLIDQKVREAFGAKPQFLVVQAMAEEFMNGGGHDQSRQLHKLQVQIKVGLVLASHFYGRSSLTIFGLKDCWLNKRIQIKLLPDLWIYSAQWKISYSKFCFLFSFRHSRIGCRWNSWKIVDRKSSQTVQIIRCPDHRIHSVCHV